MKVLGINHVGLAPKDPAKAKWFLEEILGLPNQGAELVAEQSTETTIFNSHSGGTPQNQYLLEILENQAGKDGPIAQFLATKGSGIHHLAIDVDNLDEALAELKAKGIMLINETPKIGVCRTRIAFIHPKSTGGLLIELVEHVR